MNDLFESSPAGPLRCATGCALVPALLGCGSLVVWLLLGGAVDDLGGFVWAGIASLFLGAFAQFAGFFALLVARARGARGRTLVVRVLLLLANFPLAGLCVGTVIACSRLHVFEVRNHTGVEVSDLRLFGVRSGPWPAIEIPSLGPGEEQRLAFLSRPGVALSFSYREGAELVAARADEQLYTPVLQPMNFVLELRAGGEREMVARPAERWHWLELRYLLR